VPWSTCRSHGLSLENIFPSVRARPICHLGYTKWKAGALLCEAGQGTAEDRQ
jgi:hypothetical protein